MFSIQKWKNWYYGKNTTTTLVKEEPLNDVKKEEPLNEVKKEEVIVKEQPIQNNKKKKNKK